MKVRRIVKFDEERVNEKKIIRDVDGDKPIYCPLSLNSCCHIDCALRQIKSNISIAWFEQPAPKEKYSLFCGEKIIGIIEDSSLE